jgi:hypothetical protein
MFVTGQKVVCVDDRFPLGIQKFYSALPKKDVVYVVRGTTVGVGLDGTEGEICVYLIGLVNPCSSKPPHRERGFKADRFRPLDELKDRNVEQKPEKAGAYAED